MNVCETCVCIFIMYFVMNQRGLQPALRVLVRYAGVYECEVRESFPTFQPPVISGLPGIFGIVLHGQLKTWSKRWRMTGTLGHLGPLLGARCRYHARRGKCWRKEASSVSVTRSGCPEVWSPRNVSMIRVLETERQRCHHMPIPWGPITVFGYFVIFNDN